MSILRWKPGPWVVATAAAPAATHRAAAAARAGAAAWLACAAVVASAAIVGPDSPTPLADGTPPATTWVVNPDGLGHVHLVPFYTVRSGFDTYLSLTNTDIVNGKAVKVRFRTAANGDTVFDFTLLLAPGDVWAGAVTRDAASGLPRLTHADTSCTLPADVRRTFGTARLDPALGATEKAQQAGFGSVDVITMADVPFSAAQPSALAMAIGQPFWYIPRSCSAAALEPLAVDAVDLVGALGKGLSMPTTGLRAQWTLLNVVRGTAFSGAATALEARGAGGRPGYGNVVLFPQTDRPLASLAAVRQATADPLLRGGVSNAGLFFPGSLADVRSVVAAVESDLPDLSTPYLPGALGALALGVATRQQTFAIGRALSVTSMTNEYVTDPAIAAKTSWIVAAPTLRYHIARQPVDARGCPVPVATNLLVDDAGNGPLAAVGKHFDPWTVSIFSIPGLDPCPYIRVRPNPALADWPVSLRRAHRDREGSGDRGRSDGKDAAIPGTFDDLLFMVQLYRFGVLPDRDTPLFGISDGLLSLYPSSENTAASRAGWSRTPTTGLGGQGLPLIGFAAIELSNGAAGPGFAGSYGLTLPFTVTRP